MSRKPRSSGPVEAVGQTIERALDPLTSVIRRCPNSSSSTDWAGSTTTGVSTSSSRALASRPLLRG